MNKELLDYVKDLTKADKKTLSQKVTKLFEEGGELAKKTLPFEDADGTRHKFTNRSGVLEEVADVILVALSIGYELNMSDEELNDFLTNKSKYWQSLQQNEADIDKILPYEIHVTVDFDKYVKDTKIESYEWFERSCAGIGVKPLLLRNYSPDKDKPEAVVMANSTLRGTAREADNLMEKIAKEITAFGFKVSRKKIETVPWHPASTQRAKPYYFENHMKVKAKERNHKLLSKELIALSPPYKGASFGLSWNALKEAENGIRTYFVTYRNKDITRKDFGEHAKMFAASLASCKYVLEITSENIELAVYDSAEHQDKTWITVT